MTDALVSEAISTSERRGVGRPANPEIDTRIMSAAAAIFVEHGWAGFTLEAIGKRAGIGKSSIYKRFRSREDVMKALIEPHMFDGRHINTGNFSTDLRELIMAYAEWLDGPDGRLSLRFFVESRLNEQFRELWLTNPNPVRARARLGQIVERAQRRGEISSSLKPIPTVTALLGGVVQYLAASRLPSGRVFTLRTGAAFLDELVETSLRALAAIE